ncbi:MAG: tRNA (guanosine(37)-N1)-methyltransferase TrmD [Clostridiales bacterium]|nr:tRNA (guanosine(37)-N1)-methyltransferase TrmD [Clostridiales bacterium]
MQFDILTIFPSIINAVSNESIIGRAVKKGLIQINAVNIRDFSVNKHFKTDDYPYGGGHGMVMTPQPVYDAYLSLAAAKAETETEFTKEEGKIELSEEVAAAQLSKEEEVGGAKLPRLIYMSPQGRVLNQGIVDELRQYSRLAILCGHYEGIDERIIEEIVDDEISIGDYVLTGGELPALILVDAISRTIPGVLPDEEAFTEESHYNGLLEYPQYSRPAEWRGRQVPEVLLSGHHAKISKWRRMQAILRTLDRRPDMIEKVLLDGEDRAYLAELRRKKSEQSRNN